MLTRLEEPEEPEVIEEPEEPVRSIVLGDGTFGATHTFSAVTVTSLGRPAIVTDNQARCADQMRRSESMGAASFAGRSGRPAGKPTLEVYGKRQMMAPPGFRATDQKGAGRS